MVQLKGFRYLESDERHELSLSDANVDLNLASNECENQIDNQNQDQETTNNVNAVEMKNANNDNANQRTSSTSSSSSSLCASSSTLIGGGNLISRTTTPTSNSLERQEEEVSNFSSSNEEYQEARVDMRADDDQDSELSGGSSDLEKRQQHHQRTTTDQNNQTTTISIQSNRQDSTPVISQTAKLSKLKLYQPKGLVLTTTTTTTTDQSHFGRPTERPTTIGQVRSCAPGTPLASKGRHSYGQHSNPNIAADNMSQYSVGQQKSARHFEIRWQNIRLVSARHSSWPRPLTDNPLYRLVWPPEEEDQSSAGHAPATCYSPPIQHKIPPTISEEVDHGLEMTTTSSKSNPVVPDELVIPLSGISVSNKAQQPQPQPQPQPAAPTQRCILNNISGSVASGQMTAILGPSGVGKTTLLNSLTGRNTLDGTGRVRLIGGVSKRMSVVTVPQVDVLPGKLTTLEDLQFTSRLKNPQAKFDHRRNIDRLVKHLHMEKFLYTKIDKLSGGEERRLSIARELLSSPDILILDEPTSGLDANTCKKIITALRDIVEHSDYILDKPMSIIITIHQPQQEVYNLFHRVYVMAVGGRAIYGGPPDLLLPTILERSSLGRTTPVEQLNENPAIVAIEVASGEYGPAIIDELAANHESQMWDEFSAFGDDLALGWSSSSPMATPLSMVRNFGPTLARKAQSPLVTSISPRIDTLHRKRLNSTDSSIGRPTPSFLRKNLSTGSQMDRMSAVTSVSYASTYDADLPEQVSKLKVDKRLRRSVVMKGDLVSHTLTLMQRCWLLSTRDMFLMAIRVLGFLLVAAGTVQIFSDAIDPNEHQCPQYETEVDDVIGFMETTRLRLGGLLAMLRQANSNHLLFFHLLLCITMVTSALTGLVFPIQMRMFMREYKNGWYSPSSFVISQTLAELPVDMIGPILTLIIAYPLCNQPTSLYYWREIGYIIIFILSAIICKAQAQFVAAILMDSVEMSVFMSCVAVTFPALLSGIPIRVSQMSAPLRWASCLSFLRYSFESLMSIRYGYGMCPCDPELVYGYPTNATNVALPANLNNMARGFFEINGINYTDSVVAPLAASDLSSSSSSSVSTLKPVEVEEESNLFLRFIRLMTSASNLFVANPNDLGDCQSYRSLYLMSIDVPNDRLPSWLLVMLVMFVVSRFLIYFVVKTVIKVRR